MVKLSKVLQGDALAPRHFDGTKDCLSVTGYSDFKGYRRKRRNRITDLKKMLTSSRRRDSGYSDRKIHSIITEARDTNSENCRYCRMSSADGSEYCTYCRSTTDPAGRRGDVFAPEYSQFLSTGRSGRRNAMLPNPAEEQHAHAHPAVYHLSDRFKELSTVSDQPGTSNQDPSTPGTSKQHG